MSHRYWKLLSRMIPEDKRVREMVDLAFEADMDEFVRDAVMKQSRDRTLREAADFGRDAKNTSNRVTDPNAGRLTRDVYSDIAGKERMAKALADDDISYIIEHAKELNEQGMDALLQLLEERGDVNKMFSLNKVLRNKFMNTDVNDATIAKRKIDRFMEQLDAQSDVDSKFVRDALRDDVAIGGYLDETPIEMSGMQAQDRGSMHNNIRKAMVKDRLKKKQPFLGDMDELLADQDIPSEWIASHPRYLDWKKDKEEELINKAVASKNMDLRRQNKNRIASGYGRTFDDIGEIHERANRAPLREVVDSDNIDYILDQFEEARDLERAKPTPRARDYGEETLYLKNAKSGNRRPSLQERRKELIEAASHIKGEGRNVSIRKFSPTGKKEGYTTKREKELLRKMYPSSGKIKSIGPEYREYLDKESRDFIDKVKDKKHKAASKIVEKYRYRDPVSWSARDYADFVKGRAPRKTELEAIRNSESRSRELADLEDKYTKYVGSKNLGKNIIEYSNETPITQGMNISKWDKPATRDFIMGISKQNGFRFSEQMIDRMLRMTKQQVIDFIDNISNPG